MSQLLESIPKIIGRDDAFPVDAFAKSNVNPEPEFITSVRNNGVMAPLIVVPNPPDSPYKYRIIDGLRRQRAAVLAGRETIPIVIFDMEPVFAEQAVMMLNSKRSRNPVAELQGVEKAMMTGHLGEAEIHANTGVPLKEIRELLEVRILISEFRVLFDSYQLSLGDARKIAKNLAGKDLQKALLDDFIESKEKRLSSKRIGIHIERHKGASQPGLDGTTSQKAFGAIVLPKSAFIESILQAVKELPEVEIKQICEYAAILFSKATGIPLDASIPDYRQFFPDDEPGEATEPPKDEPAPTPPAKAVNPPTEPVKEVVKEPAPAEIAPPKADDSEVFAMELLNALVTWDIENYDMSITTFAPAAAELITNGYTTLAQLSEMSVYRFMELTGFPAAIAEALHSEKVLSPIYDPNAAVWNGVAEGQRLRLIKTKPGVPDTYELVFCTQLEVKVKAVGVESSAPRGMTHQSLRDKFVPL